MYNRFPVNVLPIYIFFGSNYLFSLHSLHFFTNFAIYKSIFFRHNQDTVLYFEVSAWKFQILKILGQLIVDYHC